MSFRTDGVDPACVVSEIDDAVVSDDWSRLDAPWRLDLPDDFASTDVKADETAPRFLSGFTLTDAEEGAILAVDDSCSENLTWQWDFPDPIAIYIEAAQPAEAGSDHEHRPRGDGRG